MFLSIFILCWRGLDKNWIWNKSKKNFSRGFPTCFPSIHEPIFQWWREIMNWRLSLRLSRNHLSILSDMKILKIVFTSLVSSSFWILFIKRKNLLENKERRKKLKNKITQHNLCNVKNDNLFEQHFVVTRAKLISTFRHLSFIILSSLARILITIKLNRTRDSINWFFSFFYFDNFLCPLAGWKLLLEIDRKLGEQSNEEIIGFYKMKKMWEIKSFSN